MQFLRVSDVVNELSVARQDDSRTEWLRYMILSKSVLRELKMKYINDFVRVYLPIDQATMTVRLPLDFQRFRTISLIEECRDARGVCTEKVIPLTHNPYINITPVPTEPLNSCNVCACTPTHPVCSELSNYTTLCEEVSVDPNASPPLTGTKQTVLRTCANGDIIKEVTQPTQKFIEGDNECDYAITTEILRNYCTYISDWKNQHSFTFTTPVTISFTVNGILVTSGALISIVAFDNYMYSLGWEIVEPLSYSYFGQDVYGTSATIIDNNGTDTLTISGTCQEETLLSFPYTIVRYNVNGIDIDESPAEINIDNQAEQDAFFADLGFTKVDATHYTKEGATDVYFYIIIELPESPPQSPPTTYQINFTQTNCHRPLISDGISNAVTTDILCNVPVHEGCSCIIESEETIATICDCCSSYLNCCQNGALTGWSGWGYVPSSCQTNSPQPYNKFGSYSIDEQNYLIYLDSVCASKVLLSYDSDGSCSGEYLFPDYMLEAFKAGLAHKHAQYNEEITPFRRRELKMNYNEELSKLSREFTDVIRVADLISALKTLKTPY